MNDRSNWRDRILWYIPHIRAESGRRCVWWGPYGSDSHPRMGGDAQAFRVVIVARLFGWDAVDRWVWK